MIALKKIAFYTNNGSMTEKNIYQSINIFVNPLLNKAIFCQILMYALKLLRNYKGSITV